MLTNLAWDTVMGCAAASKRISLTEERRQQLIGIGLMCAACVAFSCLDAMAKYLGTHTDTLRWSAALSRAFLISS